METLTAQCAQLDAANRGWQQYQQTQADNFRTKLQDYVPVDDNASFDEIAQQLVDQIVREREDVNARFQAIEKANDELRSGSFIFISNSLSKVIFSIESTNNLEAIKQSYMNTINDLNQELLTMKDAYDELDKENQGLVDKPEKRPAEVDQDQVLRTAGTFSSFYIQSKCIPSSLLEKVSSNLWKEPFREVCFHLFFS